MSGNACPGAQELADFLLGRVDELRGESIELHLENCPRCVRQAESLTLKYDQIVSRLRAPRPDDSYRHEISSSLWFSKAFSQTPADDPSHSRQLGQYRLLEKLGQGGMGAVYKAVHVKLDKMVALKVLPAENMKKPAAVARFEREMRAVGRLSHPNIIAAYDAGEAEGVHFLVMEYVPGIDLSQLINRRGLLPVEDACEMAWQAAQGLGHAHQQGFVHRDIKPSNLMLTIGAPEGLNVDNLFPLPSGATVKVLDLGLARLTEEPSGASPLTATDTVMGTVDYMAPEQSDDARTVDHRAGIYSLGCTLFRLLTSQLPYPTGNVMKTLMAHRLADIPSLRDHRPDVPEALDATCRKMLAKAPEDRFQTTTRLKARILGSHET